MKVRRGVGRTVLLVGSLAVKVPSLRWGIKYFVVGMLANLNERERWVLSKGPPQLARVYFCTASGLLLIQKRIRYPLRRLLTREEVASLPFIGYDNNGHNAGLDEEGRVVLFDYGNSDMYLITEAGREALDSAERDGE